MGLLLFWRGIKICGKIYTSKKYFWNLEGMFVIIIVVIVIYIYILMDNFSVIFIGKF